MTTAAHLDSAWREYRYWLLLVLVMLGAAYATIFPELISDWYNDPNYSHGFLIPLISAYFIHQRWHELKSAPVLPSNGGLIVMFAALGLLAFGISATEYFTMRSSLVVFLAGMVIYLLGWPIFRISALPVGYLLFMVPLPYLVYDTLAFPLKLLVAKYSVLFLKVMGVIVWREGNIIMFPQITLEVADACSGLRSLVSLAALAVAFAFVSQKSTWKRALLVMMAVPIAILTNMFRVIATGFLAQHFGAAAAEGFFHEFAGLAVFSVAMLLLLGTGILLRRVKS